MFGITEVYKGKNTFNIFTHSFNMEQLNSYISGLLFSKSALNYIFTSDEENNDTDYVEMLRRFIPGDFFYKEKEILSKWDENKIIIDKLMDKNNGFYSFYAEALMAYLNYKILNYPLTTGVISVDETLSDQKTGADACMFCNGVVILGEAKFYTDFNKARDKIIKDFSESSLYNKIQNLYRKSHTAIVHFKDINGICPKTISLDEFYDYNIILSGFILHNCKIRGKYSYSEIDSISIPNGLGQYNIIFYHLPIKSKQELIYLIIKRALELIVDESR